MTDPKDPASTVPRAAVATKKAPASRMRLLVIGEAGVRVCELPPVGEVTVGRGEGPAAATISIDDPQVSRRHALLTVGRGLLRVRDLGSVNGTQVRDLRLAPGQTVEARAGDVIDLGGTVLVVQSAVGGDDDAPGKPIVIRDAAMQRLHRIVERVAAGAISVLLLGETGAGKEVLAETIHRLSPRAGKPILRLHCAALSESLLESELFGHERGAFTGAVQAKPGLLETAEGGTVFLDEIGELPLSTQVKLLRVLEERRVQRVGALKPRAIDVRFISATNRDLEEEVRAGRFRQDLYFRLNGISLSIPPLRERVAEIEPLARAFVRDASRQANLGAEPVLSAEALVAIQRQPWPGNIRELRNVMERAVLLCTDGVLRPEHLSIEKPRAGRMPTPPPAMDALPPPMTTPGGLRDQLDALERQRIVDALDRCAGNQTRAAKELGISRRTLVTRLENYHLPRPRK